MQASGGPVATPHSGVHYDAGTTRRAFEGYYLRLTLEDGTSFAFIHEVSDPAGESPLSKVSTQVMWSGGGYLMEHTRDVSSFWAEQGGMAFGGAYELANGWEAGGNGNGGIAVEPDGHSARSAERGDLRRVMPAVREKPLFYSLQALSQPLHSVYPSCRQRVRFGTECLRIYSYLVQDEFFAAVRRGFQASDTLHCGAVRAVPPDGDMLRSVLPEAAATPSSAETCAWAYDMRPVYGWGGPAVRRPEAAAEGEAAAQREVERGRRGKATTGWLAASPLFDPQASRWSIPRAEPSA